MLLFAAVSGLDEIHDAPQIEQAIPQRRAGDREGLFRLQSFYRRRHRRAGILDELRLVENDGAESKLLKFLEIAAQERVIGHDQVVLRNSFAQSMPRGAALEHEHFQMRRETVRFAA